MTLHVTYAPFFIVDVIATVRSHLTNETIGMILIRIHCKALLENLVMVIPCWGQFLFLMICVVLNINSKWMYRVVSSKKGFYCDSKVEYDHHLAYKSNGWCHFLNSGGSRGYATSEEESEKVIKTSLSDSFFLF